MKKLAVAILTALLSASAANADVWQYGEMECNELWFMRNLIMDRNGYCFGTNLGKALYDNDDCRGKQVTLTLAEQEQVAQIQKLERQIGCKVNTGARGLNLPHMAALRRLRDMPLPDNGGSACTWVGAPLRLRDGYGTGAAVIGQVNPGDRILFGWIGTGGSTVIASSRGNGPETLGWLDLGPVNFGTNCTDWAG